MLNTMSLMAVTTALAGQAPPTGALYPDGLDILRGADTTPQIQMVLDSSCSMGWPASSSPSCPYYQSLPQYSGSYARVDVLKAAMVGCNTAFDGVLDQPFVQRAIFALRLFGTGGTDGLTTNGGFDTSGGNVAGLQNDILAITPSGGTPLGDQYAAAASYQEQFFRYDALSPTNCGTPTTNGGSGSCNNTLQCRQNYLVVMTDGESNGGPSVYNFGGLGALTVNDLNGAPPHTDAAAAYLAGNPLPPIAVPPVFDLDPDVDGNQSITTYTVAFSAPATAATLLTNMANLGNGFPYNATSYLQLAQAFQDIILRIVARSNVAFSPGTIQNDGLFSGNYIYATSFRPFDRGYWQGTTKKYCVDPVLAGGPADTTCFFVRAGGLASGTLLLNPQPTDLWTLTNAQVATVGGTGEVLANNMGLDLVTPSNVPGSPYANRKILTWDPGTTAWIDIVDPGSLTPAFTQTSGACQHAELINKLYGYTDETIGGCSGAGAYPANADVWPVGDTVNGSTTLIRYDDDCETAPGQCFLAVNSNEGMLHFYDTFDGREITAVIPGHLWRDNLVATNQLRDVMDQPNLDTLRRYYFDGRSRLYHDDRNGNGNIDAGETAYLIIGLGRGGRQYLKFDVSVNFAGDFEASGVVPQALMVDDEQSSLRHLRETWAPMWVGNFRDTVTQNIIPTGIFPSGHDREDDISLTFGSAVVSGLPPAPNGPGSQRYNQPIGNVNMTPVQGSLQSALNQICASAPAPFAPVSPAVCAAATCTPCGAPPFSGLCATDPTNPAQLTSFLATVIASPASKPCMDWPGWDDLPASPLVSAGGGTGYTFSYGPFSYNPGNGARAYRINFSNIDLQPNDYISIQDSLGTEVVRYTGSVGAQTTPWIYDTAFQFTVVTDGIDDVAAAGWTIGTVDYLLGNVTVPTGTRRPSIYFLNLNNFNHGGSGAVSATTFNDMPNNAIQEGAVLARITSDCTDSPAGANGICVDATSQPDLAAMVCPISAEMTVYREGGLFRTGYVGDECGQIWAIDRDPATTPPAGGFFRVRRLAHLNNVDGAGMPIVGDSKDFRKIFTKLDVVISTCTGARRLGVYFGTGNQQRPALDLYLRNPAITTPPSVTPASAFWPATAPGPDASGGRPDRDVFGVVWDDGSKRDVGLEDMYNTTFQVQVDYTNAAYAPQTTNGWYIVGTPDEKILRDPLVIDGVAYFKSYTPVVKATECVSATGVSITYAMDNCTAAPIADTDASGSINVADRETGPPTASDIGGNLLLYTPADGTVGVYGDPPAPTDPAAPPLTARPNRRAVRLYMWRLNVDPQF